MSSLVIKRARGGWQRRYSMALHREENKVPLMQSSKCKWRNPQNWYKDRARKIAIEGLIWPLHEGREIWGADGAFASIIHRQSVKAYAALNELIFFANKAKLDKKHFTFKEIATKSGQLPFQVSYDILRNRKYHILKNVVNVFQNISFCVLQKSYRSEISKFRFLSELSL